MGIPILQVDAFTANPFSGNPAAVCLLSNSKADGWMQQVAAEMNLSETAFLLPEQTGYRLRWFTPTMEVDLCGHATLASAHVLWSEGHVALEQPCHFHTRSGLLTADRQGEWIELNFPTKPAQATDQVTEPVPEILAALGVTAQWIGKNEFDYLVEVASAEMVRQLQPDLVRLKTLPLRGTIVTSRADTPDYDFVSRFFAPGAGIDEDPVTGSAHCCLAPFWGERLGKTELVAYQASSRGGVVKMRWADDRVFLGGQAVTVMRGELAVGY